MGIAKANLVHRTNWTYKNTKNYVVKCFFTLKRVGYFICNAKRRLIGEEMPPILKNTFIDLILQGLNSINEK